VQGVLTGFVTIGAVIAVGMLLAQFKVLDLSGQRVLSGVAFLVASPALMVTVLGSTDTSTLLSANLIASLAGVAVSGGLYVLLARLVWRRTAADTVVGTFAACYVNAGNLGLPIAAYALGNASLIAPMLLTQLLVLQPVGLAVLDTVTRPADAGEPRGRRIRRRLTRPLRNPLLLGSLAGLVLSLTGIELPAGIRDPLELLGGLAVPAMLLAYGVALRLGPLPGAGEPVPQIGAIIALKLVVQPVTAGLIGHYLIGLDGLDLFAVTLIAALPTAQNVFNLAVRYRCGEILARDAIFVSTVLSVPALIIIAALLA
jgi:malonate transporter and related proteins